jgi:flavin-dependent dehydrogenase
VDDVVLRSPTGRLVHLPLPRDGGRFSAVARRADLDAALVALARNEGIEIREGHALRTATVEAGTGDLRAEVTGTGIVRARYAIGADGMWSTLRRALGATQPGYRGEWHAMRQYVRDVSAAARRDLAVWFEPDLLPGYAWSFPIGDGAANVGFGIQRGGSYQVGDMGALWRELRARPHIRDFLGPDATDEGPPRAWPIPARVETSELTAGPVLFVGDAATATDPMTGEGIGQALLTGRWAAEAILAHDRDRTGRARNAVRAAYEARITQELAVDHRMAARLVAVLRHRRAAELALRITGSTDWTRRHFARWLFEDYPRALLLTPERWHRGMFTGPGAYRATAEVT